MNQINFLNFIRMKFFKHFLFAFLLLVTATTIAQVGIGTTNPAASAQLDISSNNKGLLPPRITKVARDGIVSPVAGLMIWCNDCGDFGQIQVYNGIDWTNMLGGVPAGLAIGDGYGGGIVYRNIHCLRCRTGKYNSNCKRLYDIRNCSTNM